MNFKCIFLTRKYRNQIVNQSVSCRYSPCLHALGNIFLICWITLHLGDFQCVAIGKNIKIKPEPKLCKIIALL